MTASSYVGGPDRHYRTNTADRSLVRQAIWDWTIDGPAAIAIVDSIVNPAGHAFDVWNWPRRPNGGYVGTIRCGRRGLARG